MLNDRELLSRFVSQRSDEAFRELVNRHASLVYAVAWRKVGGDSHLARDVAQTVFVDLARNASRLVGRPVLESWLFTSARFAAAKAVRSRQRRQSREHEAHLMHALEQDSAGAMDCQRLQPLLDDLVGELSERDREAVLLRFLKSCDYSEIGEKLRLSDDGARSRVERALEKMRASLRRRGILSTAAMITEAMAKQPVAPTPVGLAGSVAGTALAAGSAWSALLSRGLAFAAGKTGTGLAILLCAGAFTGWEEFRTIQLRQTVAALRAERLGTRSIPGAKTGANRAAGQAAIQTGAGKPAAPDWLFAAQLKKRGLIQNDLYVGSEDDNTLDPAFVRLFDLSEAEQRALQEAIAQARLQLGDLRMRHLRVHSEGKDKVVIEVASFAQEGKAVENSLLASFQQTLGPERYDAFLALGEGNLPQTMDDFGDQTGTATIVRHAGLFGATTYSAQYNHEHKDSHGDGYSGSTGGDTSDLKALEARWGPIAQVLPPDF